MMAIINGREFSQVPSRFLQDWSSIGLDGNFNQRSICSNWSDTDGHTVQWTVSSRKVAWVFAPKCSRAEAAVWKFFSKNFLVKKSKISEKEKVQTEKSKKKSEESCFSLKNCLNFRLWKLQGYLQPVKTVSQVYAVLTLGTFRDQSLNASNSEASNKQNERERPIKPA